MMATSVCKKRDLYFRVREAYKKAHTHQTNQTNHENAIKIWNAMKTSDNLPDVVAKYEEEQAMVSLKKKGQLLGFWNSLPYKVNISQGQGQAELGSMEGNSTAYGTES